MAESGDELVLVRHGETEWSRTGKHTGRTDVPLTDLGRRQADQLAEMLATRSFARVLCSPLARAVETCKRAGLLDHAELTDDALEWDYGAYEGQRTVDIREQIPSWSVWTHPIIDGESVAEVGARADRMIDGVDASKRETAVFAHGHVLRVLAARWCGLASDAGRFFALNTATISVLGHERENKVIRGWNDECHLRGVEPLL